MTPAPNPNTDQVNQLAAMSNSLVAVQKQINDWNSSLIADYTVKHDNWVQTELNRPGTLPEPQPPMAWVMGWAQDPTSGPGSLGIWGDTIIWWPTPIQGTHPVCAPLPGPPKTSPSQGSGFMQNFSGTSPFNNSVPMFSVQVAASDGGKWIRVSDK